MEAECIRATQEKCSMKVERLKQELQNVKLEQQQEQNQLPDTIKYLQIKICNSSQMTDLSFTK